MTAEKPKKRRAKKPVGPLRLVTVGGDPASLSYTETGAVTINYADGARLPLGCPHARPDWRTCPHCLGVNDAR